MKTITTRLVPAKGNLIEHIRVTAQGYRAMRLNLEGATGTDLEGLVSLSAEHANCACEFAAWHRIGEFTHRNADTGEVRNYVQLVDAVKTHTGEHYIARKRLRYGRR